MYDLFKPEKAVRLMDFVLAAGTQAQRSIRGER